MLSEILKEKKRFIEKTKSRVPLKELLRQIETIMGPRSFLKAIVGKGREICLIAEVKRASPTAGMIRESFDPVVIAQIYQSAGADAVSVLTDEPFFMGCLDHLRDVKLNVRVPVLRKDFILDPYQIYEARAAGADAVLLIADLLSEEELKEFLELTRSLKMEALVEVHTTDDLNKSVKTGAAIIGVNQRNLRTFKIHREVVEQLIGMVPKGKIIVCESGIRGREDILYLKTLGIHAVLIGETFMRSGNIAAKVRELLGKGDKNV